jgi:hypothetical protein
MMKPEPIATALRGAERFRQILGIDALLRRDLLFHRDGDNGGAHAFDKVGEAERRAVFQHAGRGGMCGRLMRGHIGNGHEPMLLRLRRGAEAHDKNCRSGTRREKLGPCTFVHLGLTLSVDHRCSSSRPRIPERRPKMVRNQGRTPP